MVEGFDVPFDQGEILAVMFRVAARALLARTRLDVVGGMQVFALGEARSNLTMAVQAFEGGLAGGQLLTSRAVGGAVKGLVGAGKRAGRNLRRDGSQKNMQENGGGRDEQKRRRSAWRGKSSPLY